MKAKQMINFWIKMFFNPKMLKKKILLGNNSKNNVFLDQVLSIKL